MFRRGLGTLAVPLLVVALAATVRAQGRRMTMGRSLGGYGEATIGSYYQSRGGPLIPYGGSFGGFIPYRGIEAPPPAVSAMMPRRPIETPIGGTSIRMGRVGIGERAMQRGYAPLGVGRPLIRRSPLPAPASASLGFGSPFRRPPSP